jgi:hypothetical protein
MRLVKALLVRGGKVCVAYLVLVILFPQLRIPQGSYTLVNTHHFDISSFVINDSGDDSLKQNFSGYSPDHFVTVEMYCSNLTSISSILGNTHENDFPSTIESYTSSVCLLC